jgi:CRISPR-associated endonuclease/helicase Cas3
MESFECFFRETNPAGGPYDWQKALARECLGNRLIRVPTGFGKTLGVLFRSLRDGFRPGNHPWPRPPRDVIEKLGVHCAEPHSENHDGPPELERKDTSLAQPAGNGEACDPLAEDSGERGGEHGLRGRTGGTLGPRGGTRPPAHTTRHLETTLGILTYVQLAPHLASAVRALEACIEAGEFDARLIDDELIEHLHRCLCADLTPQLTGWRRIDVVVGAHTPPDFYRVPILAREYGRDLEARLGALSGAPDEGLLETLAFAEGRLLSIHPFADFNGRLTRVLLRPLLRRLDLPAVDLLPPAGYESGYLEALSAADRNDWRPLMEVWWGRFEQRIGP